MDILDLYVLIILPCKPVATKATQNGKHYQLMIVIVSYQNILFMFKCSFNVF